VGDAAVFKLLTEKQNCGSTTQPAESGNMIAVCPLQLRASAEAATFLRIPPFPAALTRSFRTVPNAASDPEHILQVMRDLKVGGSYWAAQPDLPSRYILVRGPTSTAAYLPDAGEPIVIWTPEPTVRADCCALHVSGECDPWHMLRGAVGFVTSALDEVTFVAGLLGVPIHLSNRSSEGSDRLASDAMKGFAETVADLTYVDPFTGEPMTAHEAAALCGFWRRLIDSNRDIAGGLGFAFWKHDHVGSLLWSGGKDFSFLNNADDVGSGSVAVWHARTRPQELAQLQDRAQPLIEVEDGFLRSQGLGADCVPPLSITVDRLGAYFDPAQPSELERILEAGNFDETVLARAKRLRELIVCSRLAKYGRGLDERIERPAGDRRHILVPGQVEDDRAVLSGGCGLASNLDLLAKVRSASPDAYIIYKPHPDVMAGHRRGAIADPVCLELADEIATDVSILSLIDMVDEVHVNTSLAGFEALMRERPVMCYGVPFYSGWGLTDDRGPVPTRRTARRTLDELVAAALIIYPRYLDPVTRLPCPPEIVVRRLADEVTRSFGIVVFMRRLQGRLARIVRSLVQ